MDQHIALLIAVLFIALILLAVLGAVLRALKGRDAYPYERSDKLFSPAERSFLGVLEQIFGNEYRILGKVRLADVIRPRKGLSNSARASAFNRISGKHVDFAICDLRTLQVVGVVELDDSRGRKMGGKKNGVASKLCTFRMGVAFFTFEIQAQNIS
jgi:hypothetical protein